MAVKTAAKVEQPRPRRPKMHPPAEPIKLQRKPMRPWFPEELELYHELIAELGSKHWAEIARRMALAGWDRNENQCRNQWTGAALRLVMPKWNYERTLFLCGTKDRKRFDELWRGGRYA
jgi:hypothetical protein